MIRIKLLTHIFSGGWKETIIAVTAGFKKAGTENFETIIDGSAKIISENSTEENVKPMLTKNRQR